MLPISARVCYTHLIMPPIPGHPRLAQDVAYVSGKPRIAGTKIGVDLIQRNIAAGMSKDMVLKVYPNLTHEDVDAALAYQDKVDRGA